MARIHPTGWGGGDNVAEGHYYNTAGEIVGTVTGVVEVTEYPSPGQGGTVRLEVEWSFDPTIEGSPWDAEYPWTFIVGCRALPPAYHQIELQPAETVTPGSYSLPDSPYTVTWERGPERSWIEFTVHPDRWPGMVMVQDTGNWTRPEGAYGPLPFGVEFLKVDTTTDPDENLYYTVDVTIDPATIPVPPGGRYDVLVGPRAVKPVQTISEQGGSVVFDGEILGITESGAYVTVLIRVKNQAGDIVEEYGHYWLYLSGYANDPASVDLSLDQYYQDDTGLRWEATLTTNSLAGDTGEVCAHPFALCKVAIYGVTASGQRTVLASSIAVPPRGKWTKTIGNLGDATGLPLGDYTHVYAVVSGQASSTTSLTLVSDRIEVDPAAIRTYVALGDSFQAGEGTDSYTSTTNSPGQNLCHRSTLAFPSLLADRGLFGQTDFEFWACGGSTIDVLYDRAPTVGEPPWDDPIRTLWDSFGDSSTRMSALERLGPETGVVTVGVGGNDVGFGEIMEGCVSKSAEDVIGNKNPMTFWWPDYSCEDEYTEQAGWAIDRIRDDRAYSHLFADITAEAENAEVIVLGYPRFFADDATTGRCHHVRWTDQLWINSEIRYLNGLIEDEARGRPRTRYVDIYDVGEDHELCEGDSDNWFMKGVSLTGGSFHPNALGHELIADAVESQVGAILPKWSGTIRPNEKLYSVVDVPTGLFLRVSIGYPGSDVALTLISPSGEVFNRASGQANLSASQGATWETVEITEPEVGEWTIELHGVDVSSGGEAFEVDWYVRPEPNEPPIAVATLEQHGGLIIVDGSGSYDPDGSIVEIGFDFGDDTVVYGETASHVYEDWGEVLVTMWVKDDRGDYGFAELGPVLEIPEYEFEGFFRFRSHHPVQDWSVAGHPIYLGFELGDDFGDDVMMPGSPTVQEVSCETGEPLGEPEAAEGLFGMTPRYLWWLGEYAWIWDTEREWGGTCRMVTFDFNDGSSASHTVEFLSPRWCSWMKSRGKPWR